MLLIIFILIPTWAAVQLVVEFKKLRESKPFRHLYGKLYFELDDHKINSFPEPDELDMAVFSMPSSSKLSKCISHPHKLIMENLDVYHHELKRYTMVRRVFWVGFLLVFPVTPILVLG